VDWVKVLQTLDGPLHLDVPRARVDHPQHDNEQCDNRLDDSVSQMNVLHTSNVSQVQRFLSASRQTHIQTLRQSSTSTLTLPGE